MAQVNYYQEDKKTNQTQQGNKTNAAQQGNKTNAVQQANISNQAQTSNLYQQSAGNGYVPVADLNAQSNGSGQYIVDTKKKKADDKAIQAAVGNKPVKTVKGNPVVTPTQPTKPTNTTTATYINEAGQKKTGVTAQTEEEAQPAEPVEEEISYWDRMRQYYQEMYDAQVAANNTAAANAAAMALENTNRQIEALQQQYAGTNKELYRNYMNQQRLLPQQLASQGYSGGMSESARLRLGTGYQEALNGNQQALANEQTALNAAYTQAQYEAQAAADAANAQALQQRYGYLAQLEGDQYSQEQAQKAERAQNLAAIGDYSGFLDLGYDQAQVDYMTRVWLKEHPELWNTWVTSNPETAKRLGIKKRTTATASYGGGGNPNNQDESTAADYIAAFNQAYNAGDLRTAYKVYKEFRDTGKKDEYQQSYYAGVAG